MVRLDIIANVARTRGQRESPARIFKTLPPELPRFHSYFVISSHA
jgi:hypothetical protein